MHRTAPSYYGAFANEWLCRLKNLYGIEPDSATLAKVKEAWKGHNTHYVTEGHLPENTPIELIEAVIIQRRAYNEVIQSDVGKAFLDKYDAAGRLRIVDTPVEVNEETERYIDDAPFDADDYPTGFCFTLNDKYDHFMPLVLNTASDVVHFSFMARGAPFFVAANNVGDFEGSDDNPRKVLTFRIGSISDSGECECLSAASFNTVPLACGSVQPYRSIGDFNAGCPLDSFVHYAVAIDYRAGVATLRHWGPSSIHNGSVLEIKLEDGVRYSYISFSSLSKHKGGTVIWNAYEDKDPRPMM